MERSIARGASSRRRTVGGARVPAGPRTLRTAAHAAALVAALAVVPDARAQRSSGPTAGPARTRRCTRACRRRSARWGGVRARGRGHRAAGAVRHGARRCPPREGARRPQPAGATASMKDMAFNVLGAALGAMVADCCLIRPLARAIASTASASSTGSGSERGLRPPPGGRVILGGSRPEHAAMNAPQAADRLATPAGDDALGRALAEAVGRYAERRPRSAQLQREAARGAARRQYTSVLFFPPFPAVHGLGRRLPAHRRRRPRLPRRARRIHRGTVRPFRPDDPRGDRARAARRPHLSSHTPGEAALAREIRARIPSMRRLRFTNSHRGQPARARGRGGAHRPAHGAGVRGRRTTGGVLSFPAAGPAKVNVPHAFVVAPSTISRPRAPRSRCTARDVAAILVEPMLAPAAACRATPRSCTGCARSPTSTARCWCSTR